MTLEKLQKLKTEGEKKQKSWRSPPNVVILGDWMVTYCVENFIRVAGISHISKNAFTMEQFYAEVSEYKRVFGDNVVSTFPAFYPMRGNTLLLNYNTFAEPFFVTG